MNARSSSELHLTAWLGVTAEDRCSVAASDEVLQKSVGDSPPSESDSTPVWKQGSSVSDGGAKPCSVCLLVRKLPLSMSVHPIQPDSVNGLPPLPGRICSWLGLGAPVPE